MFGCQIKDLGRDNYIKIPHRRIAPRQTPDSRKDALLRAHVTPAVKVSTVSTGLYNDSTRTNASLRPSRQRPHRASTRPPPSTAIGLRAPRRPGVPGPPHRSRCRQRIAHHTQARPKGGVRWFRSRARARSRRRRGVYEPGEKIGGVPEATASVGSQVDRDGPHVRGCHHNCPFSSSVYCIHAANWADTFITAKVKGAFSMFEIRCVHVLELPAALSLSQIGSDECARADFTREQGDAGYPFGVCRLLPWGVMIFFLLFRETKRRPRKGGQQLQRESRA
ncbi:hypothetical protein BC830DRAFT_695894 [Chytriomyces sp. MP71]|nr:hypothetical protein BC830DRAFT_695894 [Chytriomyces sp. MP71]